MLAPMRLTLKIENQTALTNGQPLIQVLESAGIQIGRAAYLDWQLPDPRKVISSEHADIQFRDGSYVLRDRSTNGTYVNGTRIETSNREVRLSDGDRIAIGHYELSVRIAGDEPQLTPMDAEPASAGSDVWDTDWSSVGAAPPEQHSAGDERTPIHSGDALAAAFEAPGVRTARSPGAPSPWDSGPAETTPAATASKPRRSDAARSRRTAADPETAAPPPRHAPAAGGDSRVLSSFIEAAGLDPNSEAANAPGGLERAGQTLRVLVAGLCDLLRRQGDMKSVLGVERTTVRLADNNAFKFSASPEEAVARIFVPQPGDLPGPVAAERSFDDIRKHEERLLTAINDAVRRIVEKLSPQEIKRRETGGVMDMLIPGGRRAAWWDELEREHSGLLENDGAKLDELIEEELRGAFTRHL
jgi:type VI secretion system protein ImpI/type VI secretion system protein